MICLGCDPEVCELWATLKDRQFKAEKALKRSEAINKELFTPAINELRCLGSHVFDVLRTDSLEDAQEHLRKAIEHAERAIYDTMALSIVGWVERVALIKNELRGFVYVLQEFQGYEDVAKPARLAEKYSRSGELTSRDKHRKLDYSVAEDYIKALETYYAWYEERRTEVWEKIRHIQDSRKWTKVAAVFAVLGFLWLLLGDYAKGVREWLVDLF